MRRFLVFALIVAVTSVVFASAADLDVDGGVLQVFRIGVDIEVPVAEKSTIVVTDSTPGLITTSTTLPTDEPSTTVDPDSP
jgi:hypothetical protein